MKIAILSVSKKGLDLSLNLKNKLDLNSKYIKVDCFHKNVKKNMAMIFDNYDGIVGIMASGILIRSFTPYIQSKLFDPAILNIDEKGQFVVSMLSGHIGGANKLTLEIADLLNATPVITTATDVNNRLGIDVIARDLFFNIKNPENIVHINKAILEGYKIVFKLNKNSNFDFLHDYIEHNTLEIYPSIEYDSEIPINEINVVYKNYELTLKKQKLVVGIGCRRGKSSYEIKKGLINSLKDLNLNLNRIDMLASAEIKKDEQGILNLGNELKLPVYFVSLEKLSLFKSKDVKESEFVKKQFGIPAVCEPSALIVAGYDSKLVSKKTAYNGVTIAIAISKD